MHHKVMTAPGIMHIIKHQRKKSGALVRKVRMRPTVPALQCFWGVLVMQKCHWVLKIEAALVSGQMLDTTRIHESLTSELSTVILDRYQRSFREWVKQQDCLTQQLKERLHRSESDSQSWSAPTTMVTHLTHLIKAVVLEHFKPF